MPAQSKYRLVKIVSALLLALMAAGLAVDRAVRVGMIRLPWGLNSPVRENVKTSPVPVAVATPSPLPSVAVTTVDIFGVERKEELGPPPKVDVDAIYRRIYLPDDFPQKTEAKALRVYDQLNRPGSPGYDEGKLAIRLFVLRSTKDDQNGEAWLQLAGSYAQQAHAKGNGDELVKIIFETFSFRNRLIFYGYIEDEYLRDSIKFQSSSYPTVLKMCNIGEAIQYLQPQTEAIVIPPSAPPSHDNTLDPALVFMDLGVSLIEKLAKEQAPPRTIRGYAAYLLALTKFSDGQRAKYEKLIAETLVRTKSPEFIALSLRGQYLIDLAWNSRGSGYADTVTTEGAVGMADYLSQAEEVLESGATKYPDVAWFPELLMDVELGQGRGRERIEKYFQNAAKLAPHDPDPYACKMWYLQPRWYGSVEDVWEFCRECRATGRWSDSIPLVVFKGFNDLSPYPKELYANPKIRSFVQQTYEEYLQKYPSSLLWRTRFLKHSVEIEDWVTVKQQLAVLGDYWDLSVLRNGAYVGIVDEAAKH